MIQKHQDQLIQQQQAEPTAERPGVPTSSKRALHVNSTCPDCRSWASFTCQSVILLPSFCSFTTPRNLSTRTQGFCVLVHGAGGPREWIPWKWLAWGAGFLHEIFRQFHQHLPPQNAKFQSCWACPPLWFTPFLALQAAPKWAALALNLCTQDCAHVLYLCAPHQNPTSVQRMRWCCARRTSSWQGQFMKPLKF